jgi:hypothetical protein
MAKKKMADEVKPTDVTPEVSATVEASAPAVVESTKKKFELVGGSHWAGDVEYRTGDVVESDDDLATIFKNKFKRVE